MTGLAHAQPRANMEQQPSDDYESDIRISLLPPGRR
jgi:hypothetical protein